MPNSLRQPYDLDRTVRLVISVVVVLGALWLIERLKGVLLPFCVACLMAYMMEPFVQYNRKLLNLKGRLVAIFVTLFEALFFACIIAYFVVPMLMEEVHELARIMRSYSTTEMSVRFLPNEINAFIKRQVDFARLSDIMTRQDLGKLIENVLSTLWSILSGGISVLVDVFSWLIVFLYMVFIMIDYDRLSVGFKKMVPPKYRATVYKIGTDIQHSMNHYFRGQALVALIVGVLFSIGFLIVGLPLAIVLGLFIGLLNMVPYLQLISIVPTVLLCLVYAVGGGGDFWSLFFQCMAVYCIVQVIQDMFLTPKIMGKAMGLNPAIILLSLSVWGSLLGLMGLIIALPLTTLLLSYYNYYIIQGGEHLSHEQPINKKESITVSNGTE